MGQPGARVGLLVITDCLGLAEDIGLFPALSDYITIGIFVDSCWRSEPIRVRQTLSYASPIGVSMDRLGIAQPVRIRSALAHDVSARIFVNHLGVPQPVSVGNALPNLSARCIEVLLFRSSKPIRGMSSYDLSFSLTGQR